MTTSRQDLFRAIPSYDAVIKHPDLQPLLERFGRAVIVEALRTAAETIRQEIANGRLGDPEMVREATVKRTIRETKAVGGPFYHKAINGTGIILHTGLGRAVLAPRALAQIAEQLGGYSILQVDQDSGKRGDREGRIEWLLQKLTGCEAATVVNNNAAATVIALNTVAKGREVIVSRGQLVEIGGAFRLPEIMAVSGVTMREVGTTNKTHLRDYAGAINENTAAILRVHPSNYRIHGFTAEVGIGELEQLAHSHGLCLIDDVGAGALLDFSRYGFQKEPTLPEEVAAGSDLITCSGDKLIGAAQSGIILGRAAWIAKIKKNPLARVLRVDKLTLAVLEATLGLFLDEETALGQLPTLRMLRRTPQELNSQAERIAIALQDFTKIKIGFADDFSQMGSGSLPEQNLPTTVVTIAGIDLDRLAFELRQAETPVIGRIKDGRFQIDPRTLLPGDEELLIAALRQAIATILAGKGCC